jgi:hypothetical protein
MRRTWCIVGSAISLVSVISAQGPAPAAPSSVLRNPAFLAEQNSDGGPDGQAASESVYVIEMRVLEGTGLNEDGSKRRAANLPRGVRARKSDAAPGNTAVLPQPSPTLKATPPVATATTSSDDDLWDECLRKPSITVLAAPKVTLDSKQPATVQIQTEAMFTYLQPLGDGKFEAKQSGVHELGMKFTIQVQPIAGEDEFVDVAPLEIQISSLDGREPVEGLDLDVGKPIVATRSLKTTAKMKLGAVRLIAIPSGPSTQAALLLRVSRLNQQEK